MAWGLANDFVKIFGDLDPAVLSASKRADALLVVMAFPHYVGCELCQPGA